MYKLELKQIYLQLDLELKRWSDATILAHRSSVTDDTHQTIRDLKPEIDSWVSQLNDRKIACHDLENLLEKKRDDIKLKKVEKFDLEPDTLENFKGDILRMIAKAIMNSYLESLFRKSHKKFHEEDDLFEN